MSETARAAREFTRLVEIMATLRGPDGCPWDREQTIDSLKPFVLEETYEVLEAIDRHDHATLCEELGDFVFEAVVLPQPEAGRGGEDAAERDRAGAAGAAPRVSHRRARRVGRLRLDEARRYRRQDSGGSRRTARSRQSRRPPRSGTRRRGDGRLALLDRKPVP